MKAQFFILGAILLAALFFAGLPLIKPSLTIPTQDMPFIARNLRAEFPFAFNLGLNQTEEVAVMENYTRFLNASLEDHLIEFQALWIFSKNTSTTSANFTAGNFLDGNTTVRLNISGTHQNITAPLNGTNFTVFSSPGSIFNLTITFGAQEKTVEWLRDKVNLYVFFQLRRGNEIIKEEVVA